MTTIALGVISTGTAAFANVTKGMTNLAERQRTLLPSGPQMPWASSGAMPAESAQASNSLGSTVAPAQGTERSRRFFKYPHLAIITIGSLAVFYPLYLSLAQGNQDDTVLYVAGALGFVLIGSAIYAVVKSIQLRRWGWLLGMLIGFILAGGFAPLVFSIAGPTTRRS